MLTLVLKWLLRASPTMDLSEIEIAEYRKLASTIHGGQLINYDLPFPKQRFLYFLSLQGDYLFHGSNKVDIDRFEPREQTLYNGQLTKAVFASSEPMWSIFYAVLNKKKVIGNFRKGCIVNKNNRFHFYSLSASTIKNDPWTEGMIYIVPKDNFNKSGKGAVHFEEWVSSEFVTPVGKIHVDLDDFYYKDKVAVHDDHESLLKTWLLYKIRTMRVRYTARG